MSDRSAPGRCSVTSTGTAAPSARLQPAAVSRIVTQLIFDVLGEPAELYSSHSLRAGFVTEARAHHTPDPLIARHTRHKDLRMLGVYDRPRRPVHRTPR